jgi:sarcosine oxidase, subunit beta
MGSPDTAETVIVGAGLAGLGLAWHLGDALGRTVVVEQGARPGAEASSDGVGMVRRLTEDPVERALSRRTAAWLRALPERDWPSSPARASGALVGAVSDPTWLADGVASLRAHGVAVEDAADVGRVAPIAAGAPLARAWWLPDEQLVDPGALLAGFRRGAERAGATLRCDTRVTGLQLQGERVVGIDTDRGPLHAERVVLAAGAWCAGLARAAGLHRPLFPLRRSVVRVPASGDGQAGGPWVWIDDEGLYARPAGGAWWVSSCDERVAFPPSGPGSRGPSDEAAAERAQARIARLLPGLAGRAVEAGWSGLRTFAPDRRPVLGPDPERAGLWWVAGLGGSGVACGSAAAEAVACWMKGEPTPWLPMTPVSPGRPFPRRWPIRADGSVGGTVLVSGVLDGTCSVKRR